MTPPPLTDAVNHPAHYQSGGLEVIDVVEAFGLDFHLGNVVRWYLDRAIGIAEVAT